MKYLITFIVIAIITFVTINAKKKPNSQKKTTTTTPSPPKWKNWNGTQPFSAKEIVKNATELYFEKTGEYYNLTRIILNQTRTVLGTDRYRVKYTAAKCISSKSKKNSGKNVKSKKNKKPKCVGTVKMDTQFQAILKDNTPENKLVLNVTNLRDGGSFIKKYTKPSKKIKMSKKKSSRQ
uniref:Cystatin domain-containing protein n=1 Tax=Strongyloides venezuelensis TaxID=75913 RepID=A0A0K0G4E1_STRVS